MPAEPAPRWAVLSSLALSAAGLAVAGYLTVEHYTAGTTLACPETGYVNCLRVTTSPESTLLGIPVALLGLIFFAAMLALSLPRVWRSPVTLLRRGRLALAGVGVVMVMYLLYVELFRVDQLCLWCTAVHGLALGLFAVFVFAEV